MKRYSQNFTKSEIVKIHTTLFYLKTFFESAGLSNQFFQEYNTLNIHPTHIYLEKHRHVTAIVLLAKGILSILNSDQDIGVEMSHILTKFERIKRNLSLYLKRDKSGIRRALLSILSDGKYHTLPEIHARLQEMGFFISLKATFALVGSTHSRLFPILTCQHFGDERLYLINHAYLPLVKSLLKI